MCDVDYLAVDLDNLTNKCACFLYDVHDPTSCAMGAVYLSSNFGGGQDPWLWTSFGAALAYVLTYWKGSWDGKDEVSLGAHTMNERVWGRTMVGGGLVSMFIIMFISRFIFAFAEPNISRNANVALSAFFSVAALVTLIGLTNCWWLAQFKHHEKDSKSKDSLTAPFPGIFRKTAHIIGSTHWFTNEWVRKAGYYLVLLLEVALAFFAFIYVLFSVLLAAKASNREDGSTIHTGFLSIKYFYSSLYIIFIIDTLLCMVVHHYQGLRLYLRRLHSETGNSGSSLPSGTVVPGCNQSRLAFRDSVLLLRSTFMLLVAQTLILRLDRGYCPYIDAEKDLYHGGDPAEAANADLANLLFLFFLVHFYSRFFFREAELFWKPSNYSLNEKDRVNYSAFDHPNKPVHQIVASILGSVSQLILSIAVIVMDSMYKYDAGMVGRILYFVGYLFSISVFSDAKLFLVVLDGRSGFLLPLRLVAVLVALYLVLSYILCLVYWLNNPDGMRDGSKEVPAFDSWLFISGLIAYVLKIGLVSIHERTISKLAKEADKTSSGEESTSAPVSESNATMEFAIEDSNIQQVEEGAGQSSALVSSAKKAGDVIRVFDDFAKIVSGFFEIWVFLAIVWNALGILLVLGLFGVCVRQMLENWFMKRDAKDPDSRKPLREGRSFSLKRSCLVFSIQIVGCFTFFIVTQMFYFLTQPLPYYERQILVAGHRGVWTAGYAENSFEAFDFAKSKGYHSVEVDMRMTKDQKLIVMHDITLPRTTNGTGFVYDYDMDWLQSNLRLKREKTDEIISEYPYDMDQAIQGALERDLILNIEVKQDKNLSAVSLALDAICRNNATESAFISTGDTRFQHLLYYLQPNVTLEKDFLLYTPTMSLMVPFNVNVYAISAELLLFNTWVIPNAHAAGLMVLVYFLAIETPAMINYFVAMGVDGFMLNNPNNCYDSGVCFPANNFTLPRIM